MADHTVNIGTAIQPRSSSMGLLAFAWRHIWLALEEWSLRGESTVTKPLEVVLDDGTTWRLLRREGVEWFLHHPVHGQKSVTSARVRAMLTKWDFKS